MTTVLIVLATVVGTLVFAWVIDKICELFSSDKANPKSKHTVKDFYDLVKNIDKKY